MRKKFILSFFLAMFTFTGVMAAPAVRTNYKFSENSLLATGKWVRVSVPETGVYEITYDQLREMGFNNPSQVTVMGRGGSALQFNFQNTNGTQIYYKDNPEPVRVLHRNNKLLFYGIGPEDMSLTVTGSGDSQNVSFVCDSRNIYTNESSYLLTDSQPVTTVPVKSVSGKDGATEKTKGFTYYYHEKDLTQSGTGTGQIFWGENIKYNQPIKFQFQQPYAVNSPAYITYRLALNQGSTGSLGLTFNNYTKTGISLTSVSSQIKKYVLTYDTFKFLIDDNGVGHGNLEFSVDDKYNSSNTLALDWFTMTCPISLSLAVNDPGFSQQYIAFPATNTNQVWKYRVPSGSVVWDITGRNGAQSIEVVSEGGKYYAYNTASGLSTGSTASEMVVFNPAAKQKEIKDWNVVANQNFHALQRDGVELIIFVTEELRNYAERIAEAHRKYDGINVVVATPQEVFNEFSNGAVDPQAYRAMAKMFYHNGIKRLKNVILMGRMSGDIRNIANEELNGTAHISYQKWDQNIKNECVEIADYYGCVTDYFANPQDLRNMPINVGVGLLPIYTHEEAANVVAKIEDYLAKEDFSNLVNETLLMACDGDNYLHEGQTADFYEKMADQTSLFDSKLVNNFMRFDGLKKENVKTQFRTALERGKLFTLYFGHANNYGLIKELYTWMAGNDLLTLDNNEMGFFFFAACDLSMPSKGKQGFGDLGVTRAKRGMIGAVCSTALVMSNENEELAKAMFNGFYYDGDDKPRTTTPTIGEAYALAKNAISNESQLAYIYLGDPALRLPLTLGKVDVTVDGKDYLPGDVIKVTGTVLDAKGNKNTNYNGYVTVKLAEPSKTIVIPKAKPKDKPTDPTVYYQADMSDFRLVAVKGEVKNGVFSVSLPVTDACKAYMSSEDETVNLPIYASTYNPTTKIGCSGVTEATMGRFDMEESSNMTDNVPPAINLSYDPYMQTLTAEVSDNVAVYPGIGKGASMKLTINGIDYDIASNESAGTTVTNYKTHISTAHLPNGIYRATATATDIAGNTSLTTNYSFSVEDVKTIGLSTSQTVAIDEIKFKIDHNFLKDSLNLVILDIDGNLVYSSEATSNEVTADLADIRPGIYRAAVRHESAKGARLYSNWVEFTVID